MKKKSRKRVKKWFKKNWIALIAIIISAFSAYYSYKTLDIYQSEVANKIIPIDTKKSELLLELISELKKVKFRVSSYKKGMSYSHRFIQLNWNINNYINDLSIAELDAPVLFVVGEKDSIMSRILEISENPNLPVEVYEKLKFLHFVGGTGFNYKSDNYHKIYFSRKGQDLTDDKTSWVIEHNNDCSLKEYLEKYISLISEIDLWLAKTTKSEYKFNTTNTPYQFD